MNFIERKYSVSSPVKLIETISETPIKLIPNGILFLLKKLETIEIEKTEKIEVFERIDKFDKFEKSMELIYYLNSTGLFP